MQIYVDKQLKYSLSKDIDEAVEIINQLADLGYLLELVQVGELSYEEDFENLIMENFPGVDLFFWTPYLLRDNYVLQLEDKIREIDSAKNKLDDEIFGAYHLDFHTFEQLSINLNDIIRLCLRLVKLGDTQIEAEVIILCNGMTELNLALGQGDLFLLSDQLHLSVIKPMVTLLQKMKNQGGKR